MNLQELKSIKKQVQKHLRLAVKAKERADFHSKKANELMFQIRGFLNSE